MNFRLSACLPLAVAFLSIILPGMVQAAAPDAALPAQAGLPDACKLMTQADVGAVFAKAPIKNSQKQFSPVYGPHYVAICGYSARLPGTPGLKFASLVVSLCAACGQSGRTKLEPESEARVAGNQVKLLSHVGDEAFEVFESNLSDYKLYVRKDDLVFIVMLDKSSAKSESNAVALARQAAKRWRGGVGMVEAATPIDTKAVVEAVPYTPPPPSGREAELANMNIRPPPGMAARPQLSVAQDKWPDPCKLLTPADIRAVFGDMTIEPQHSQVPIPMPDNIPAPRPCEYGTHKTITVNGQRSLIVNSIILTIFDMATSVDYAKKYYGRGHGDTPLPGLGDEASIDASNHIYIRKGVLNVVVYVGGDIRDRTRFEDSRTRLLALAKRVAPNLP